MNRELQKRIDELPGDARTYNWIVALRTASKDECFPDQFWTGEGWSPNLDEAKVFLEYVDALHIQWDDVVKENAQKQNKGLELETAYLRCFPVAVYRIFLEFPDGFSKNV